MSTSLERGVFSHRAYGEQAGLPNDLNPEYPKGFDLKDSCFKSVFLGEKTGLKCQLGGLPKQNVRLGTTL